MLGYTAMNLNPGQIIQIKRKILSYIRSREYNAAIKLFHKHFSVEFPPDPEFVNKVFTELNKLDEHELGFRFVEEASSFLPLEAEIQELRNTALKLYFDRLLVNGNKLLNDREEQASKFHESLKQTDSLSREKIHEENEKILDRIVKKALENYNKAYSINPDSIGAITGLYRCYKVLQDEENISKFETILEEKNPFIFRDKDVEIKQKQSKIAEEFDIEEFNINEVKSLFEKKQYLKVIERVDFLHLTHKISVPLLLLKAESLVALKRFKEADKVIFEAEKQNSCLKEVRELKNQLYEVKYGLLSRAGEIYLKKALELGPSLGINHFKKARICLRKALEIFPENLDLLDQQYTVLRYLQIDEEAFKTKAMIYILNNRFIPTFDRENSKSLCFLATFAYHNNPIPLEDFRWFRREFLLSNKFGRLINCCYVKNSQKLVKLCLKHKIPPKIMQFFLFPILNMIKLIRLKFK
jgi:tetratricopeptide (TPR) repeat protein